MLFIEILNYDDRTESVRADLIESVVKPSGRVHDGGAVVLIGGRRIALSDRSSGQCERILRELQSAPPAFGAPAHATQKA